MITGPIGIASAEWVARGISVEDGRAGRFCPISAGHRLRGCLAAGIQVDLRYER